MFAPNRRVVAWAFSSALIWAGCGSDGDDSESTVDAGAGGSESDAGGTTAATVTLSSTLVPITADDESTPIKVPHDVVLYDAESGKPLDPAVEGKTTSSGKLSLTVPTTKMFSIYVKGVGPATEADSTYDTMVLNYNVKGGETLLRISSSGTKATAESFAKFTGLEDRAALSGAIYWAPGGGTRKGAIGCAKVYIDGQSAPDEDQAQRYIGSTPLPVTLEAQDQTTRRGQFYFGNIKTGEHTIKVSIDDGKTFIHEEKFYVPYTRTDAKSETKAFLYQLGLYVDAPANPTPESCPQLAG
jgi:hypothetical protein